MKCKLFPFLNIQYSMLQSAGPLCPRGALQLGLNSCSQMMLIVDRWMTCLRWFTKLCGSCSLHLRVETNPGVLSSSGNRGKGNIPFSFSRFSEYVNREVKSNGIHFKPKEKTHFTCWHLYHVLM